MRILLDECLDPRVRLILGDHNVATVHEQHWDALEDGLLLTVAQNQFDMLVTIDRSLEFQQNLSSFQIGVSNRRDRCPRAKESAASLPNPSEGLLQAVENAALGKVIHVRTSPLSTV